LFVGFELFDFAKQLPVLLHQRLVIFAQVLYSFIHNEQPAIYLFDHVIFSYFVLLDIVEEQISLFYSCVDGLFFEG
jgi:hypothetical protein